MTKKEKLHNLKDEMEKDESLPLKKGANKLVFGSGNTKANILAVGEGPGRTEDIQGLPFVGQAGKLLDKFEVSWSKNKKGNGWNIRLNTDGIIKLAELFESIKKHNITLLHRQRIFQKKVEIAKKTNYKL